MDVIRFSAKKNHSRLFVVTKPQIKPTNLPLFQQRNWWLAYCTYLFLQKRDELKQLSQTELGLTQKTYIPARMETINLNGQTIIIDGSHNAQKLATLFKSIKQRFPNDKIAALVGFVESEESRTRAAIRELSSEVGSLIVTSFSGEQDTQKHSVDPKKVAAFCELAGFKNYQIVTDPKKAYRELRKQREPILLITGSFYLLNHIRPLILKASD